MDDKLKKAYGTPKIEIITILTSDVISTSDGPLGDDGTPNHDSNSWV